MNLRLLDHYADCAVIPITVFDWKWLVTGFVLFRFFDMLKPWPISWLDKRVHGGFGIMIDDLVAGVMAAISLAAIGYWLEWLPV